MSKPTKFNPRVYANTRSRTDTRSERAKYSPYYYLVGVSGQLGGAIPCRANASARKEKLAAGGIKVWMLSYDEMQVYRKADTDG